MGKRPRVLVLDAGVGWGSLAVVRSLGSAGMEAHLGFPLGTSERIASSRYCSGTVAYPDPEVAPHDFQRALLGLAERFDFIVPVKEPSLLAAAEIREEVEAKGATLPIASAPALATATNKVEVLRLAERVGVPIPRTLIVTELPPRAELDRTVGRPFVLKASTEVGIPPAQRHFVVTEPESSATAANFASLARHGPVVVQEFVEGFGAGVAFLYSRASGLVAFSGHRRSFEQFSDGGPSVLAQTFLHPGAFESGRQLLDALDWKGIAMVEFRISPEGRAILMEINPRVWGTMPLAIASGVDFPRLLIEQWGRPPNEAPAGPYRVRNFLSVEALVNGLAAPPAKRLHAAGFALELARSAFALSLKELQGMDLAPSISEIFHRLRSRGTRRRMSRVGRVRVGPAVEYRHLAARGIATAIDLRTADEVAKRNVGPAAGVTRISFPIPDDTGIDPTAFGRLVQLIDRASAEGRLYVHCRQGKGRAPMAVIGYLVSKNVPLEAAFKMVYDVRPSTNLNTAQRAAIYLFDRTIHPASGVGAPGPARTPPPPPTGVVAPPESPPTGSRSPSTSHSLGHP